MRRCASVFLVLVCSVFVAAPLIGIAEETPHQEGIFQVNISSAWTRMPDEMVEEMRRIMIGGGQELAKASQSANPDDINAQSFPFLSGFQLQSGNTRALLVLMGTKAPEKMDRDEMFKTNSERVQWGIDSGRLRKTTKGVSKLDIDSVPGLLQDIETEGGGRAQIFTLFVPEYPDMTYGIQMSCDDTATFEKHADEFAAIIKSIKITRKGK
jgi:hypothetical protein